MTGEGMADRDDAASVYSARALGAEAANFDDLGDAEKVKFSQAELGAAASLLDDLLARYAALRTEVQDPDGLVRLTLGSDGRLVELYIHDQIAQQLDNLGLASIHRLASCSVPNVIARLGPGLGAWAGVFDRPISVSGCSCGVFGSRVGWEPSG